MPAKNPGRSPAAPPVNVWEETVVYPTYPPCAPDPNPMFLEKRVFQGSKGTVYPLPVTECVADEPEDRSYQAVFLENEYIKVMLLPEIGGRVHTGLDKGNQYDFLYHNRVIKPALVGLAGPWIAGGIEFNWPQHHRPTTFQPVDYVIQKHPDGSTTVWMGEIEPLYHTKGMVGITLHPGRSTIEARVQIYNRTPYPQTFLWWSNLAVHVNDGYQAVFPPDVRQVADHARRATIDFPIAHGRYYDIEYDGVDISWFKHVPVPTSYMALHSEYDFLAGYDHGREAGVVHVANHHISPGKKMWTWGAAEFGQRWYRHLTDDDGPYIELMTGVYTDNQPDFAWLQPYEVKAFTQYWYPLRQIGVIKNASRDAAVNLTVAGERATIGLNASAVFEGATVLLSDGHQVLHQRQVDLAPNRPFLDTVMLPPDTDPETLEISLLAADERELVRYGPAAPSPSAAQSTPEGGSLVALAAPAQAARLPGAVETIEELYLTGLHLEQYRHATYDPVPYYQEALRRDPGDARANNALGLLLLRQGAFAPAEQHFRRAVQRLTAKNPNPYDGEPLYNLGLACRFLERTDEAYDAFYKATWNQAWQSAAFLALAELDCRQEDFVRALEHVRRSLATNSLNTQARNLQSTVLRKLGRYDQAQKLAAGTVELDILDFGARNELHLLARYTGRLDEAEEWLAELKALMRGSIQSYLDLAIDYGRAGLWHEADEVLARLVPPAWKKSPVHPMVYYYLGFFADQKGDAETALEYYRRAAAMPPDYCFPNRLESIAVLQQAQARNPQDARAPYYLGNLLYDKKQYREAIAQWERARDLDADFATVQRNLGLAYYNSEHDHGRARAAYERAYALNPQDARVLFELDQLEKRLGVAPARRLERLQRNPALVNARDDLYLEQVTLHNQLGRYDAALRLLQDRTFHPWEGGEGKVADQYVLAHWLRGRAHLAAGEPAAALEDFQTALTYPENLGEARHPVLTAEAHVHYAMGLAHKALGERRQAEAHFERAAAEPAGWTEMAYYQGLALRELEREQEAAEKFAGLVRFGQEQLGRKARADYFAISLPTFLLFEDDLDQRNAVESRYLMGLGYLGQGEGTKAKAELEKVAMMDPNHIGAQLHTSDE